MPIRMVDDPEDQEDNSDDYTGGGGNGGGGYGFNSGGGGGGFGFVWFVLGLLFRYPALLLVVFGFVAFGYLRQGCAGRVGGHRSHGSSELATGGVLDAKQFAKAPVYEGLDPGKTDLPEYVSLLKFAPRRRNQGQQGSCVAWSSAYAARTVLEAAATGENPDRLAFSPSFLYNQIKLDGCQGSYIVRAMETMSRVGAVPFDEFPYDDQDCERRPDGRLLQEASSFRMLGYNRLTGSESTRGIDLHAIKEHLSKDVPVVIGMMVGGSFMHDMMGESIWHPTEDDYSKMGFGGHALCVIGYDDRLEGGAFQIMNSWGKEWGQDGVAWVRYKDFKHFVQEAYGIDPLPKKGAAAVERLACTIGLVNAKTKTYIPLQLTQDNRFKTIAPIAKGTTFKMEVKNNTACYVYVLGKETDGSSYVLFPYPRKDDPGKTRFSPYCGITGYRLFPRGMSMQADEVGLQDEVAIIASLKPLSIFETNGKVNQFKSKGFANAVNKAVKHQTAGNVNFASNDQGTISFASAAGDADAVVCMVAIDKK